MNGNGIGPEQENGDPNHVKLTEAQLVRSEFGLPLEDCYKVAVKYYKGTLFKYLKICSFKNTAGHYVGNFL